MTRFSWSYRDWGPNQIAAGDAFEPCQFAREGLVFLSLGGRT